MSKNDEIIGEGGVPIESIINPKGGADVNIQDQTTPIVDVYMMQEININATFAQDAILNSNNLTFNPGHGAVVGNLICLKESGNFYQATILIIAGDVVTMDTPLDFAFTTNSFTCIGTNQMAVAGGTLGSPNVFHVDPPIGTRWDVVRIVIVILDNTVMDDGLFGGAASLVNGVVLRKKDGVFKNIFNAKNNGDFRIRAYDVDYNDKAPAGQNSVSVRRTFGGQSKNGVVIRLDGDTNDRLEILLQDDLSALTSMKLIVQGHVVD